MVSVMNMDNSIGIVTGKFFRMDEKIIDSTELLAIVAYLILVYRKGRDPQNI